MNLSYLIGKWLYPNFIWRVKTQEKLLYLTFDDGPHPEITPWVLAELDKYKAKASFFVVGDNAERYPELITRMLDEGHAIGNHTQHHIKGWSVTAQEYLSDIEKCQKHIPNTMLFRPPYGRINKKAIKSLSAYKIVMWDNLSRDYVVTLNRVRTLNRLKRNTSGGSIIVFHDSKKAEANLRHLLPRYLEYVYEEGFKVVAL